MSQISVSGLTFYYEGSYDNVFDEVTFQIDTDWKLGLIGRNGKGKTTLLRLLKGEMEYKGNIATDTCFDSFPYEISEDMLEQNTIDVLEKLQPEYELWRVCREFDELQMDAEVLYRPFGTLSHGERTKVMLALLFSRENYFLLIDEPTNHLDMPSRELLRDYLNQKKGFILVSHDRWLLDACVDHVLVLNRETIAVEKGNFSSWWENKEKKDAFELAENEKRKAEISKLEKAARQSAEWADKVERSKIGFDPKKDTHRCIDTRAYLAEKSRRMQQRRKNLERRQNNAIEAKKELLKDLETPQDLKLMPLEHHKEVYLRAQELDLYYDETTPLLSSLLMELRKGDRIVIQGKNGCGKSTLIKAILRHPNVELLNGEKPVLEQLTQKGILEVASGLKVSYMNQDTSWLKGSLRDYAEEIDVDESLLKAILRQLDFERVQFDKNMEDYSEGQKKKVLIAGSLLQKAHLYIWDEPLNYIDVFSRMQIEKLIMAYKPTMLIIEHDKTFGEKVATKIVRM